jgi:hypothetical protein
MELMQRMHQISLQEYKFQNFSQKLSFFPLVTESENRGLPNMEKNIIKPVDIWITLLLPTFVNPSNPMFSLHHIDKRM